MGGATGCPCLLQLKGRAPPAHPCRWWHAAAASPTSGESRCRSGSTQLRRRCRRGWNRCESSRAEHGELQHTLSITTGGRPPRPSRANNTPVPSRWSPLLLPPAVPRVPLPPPRVLVLPHRGTQAEPGGLRGVCRDSVTRLAHLACRSIVCLSAGLPHVARLHRGVPRLPLPPHHICSAPRACWSRRASWTLASESASCCLCATASRRAVQGPSRVATHLPVFGAARVCLRLSAPLLLKRF